MYLFSVYYNKPMVEHSTGLSEKKYQWNMIMNTSSFHHHKVTNNHQAFLQMLKMLETFIDNCSVWSLKLTGYFDSFTKMHLI